MTLEDMVSAKRLALTAVLLFVLWQLALSVFSFAGQLAHQRQEQQETLRTLERNRERDAARLRQNRETIAGQLAATAKPRTSAPRTTTKRPGPQGLAASLLANHLRQVNAFGLVANPQRRLHCIANPGDWDYTCLFHPDPITNDTWVQFGVLVDNAHVIEMSAMYPSDAFPPAPLSRTSK